MTLFFHNSGPLLRYKSGTLEISDLNPELHTRWAVSRWDMLRLGLRCIVASFRAS